ncbi:uncharacterized protein LOC128234657 isoform X2 [Mya arenaria]|uniref:uncharacterized protein LOC128234657 isoform X2 n=1 Tax=Mya arenaria TaxID=6604 RepID=UPI0022DF616E|nr:uncharacterized protein LOC128234657 isoform X2 [Mya arenaria]
MNERGRKKVTCEQCGKSFVSFEDLTLHQSTEKGHITPNYLSKPTSVEVRTVHQSCIRLNWSPPMGIAVHQYYIQSYNPGKQEWSSLGVVHPQMPSFIINSDMLSDLCKPVAEIGICAVNVQQQCGPRYVVQFQKIPIQVNGMGVLEYKLEKTHWQKLDWKIHHSAPYQLKNLKTSGPVGTPEKLAARQTANKDILLSWCEPGVNRDEDQDLAISSHGNFTGYSIFISKVNSDTWACVKNLNEEVYSTVIPHENIPELSEYQVGIKAKKGFHTGPMAILCFHHMKPDGSVFVNELEPCKTCNALKTKSVRSFVTKGTGINRMEVDSDDDLQVDEDVFCLEKSSKTDVFQTANHDLKRAMGRKAVFFFANHFYQPVTELPISISNVHSDGCGKIRLKVSISQDLWRTLNTTLDDQGKPLYHVFLRMGRHYGDKFEDEIPECLISVNKRIVKVQVANGLSPCKDGPVDITGSLHPNNNNIILTIKPGCEQPYMVYIHMVRKLGPKATVRRLLKERVVPQSRTKRLIKNYLTADRNSIKYCSYKVKLTCPITQGRLETPCRGDRCKHIQCMEAGTVIQMNETKKGRRCLLCKEPYNKLDIDGLFLEILQTVPSSVTEVEFNPEGEWKTVLNTDESGPSVSIDDDVVMPQLAEVLNDHTEVDSECEAIAGFHKDVQGKTDDVPQVKIENVEGESWSTENGGWYLSQYGLELKDNDVELVDAEVRQDIGMQFATESNVNHCADQTDGMICDNNSSNLKVEDFSYSKDDNEAEDMSIQNIDIFPHKKGSAQDTSTSQIMIEDQESGKRVYLYENILSEDGDEFLSCESELEKRKSESLEGDHNVNNHDALGLAFNFTQATSSSQNSNVEETVTMDTSWNGREIIEVDKDLCTTEDMSLCDDLKEPSDRRSPHQRRRKCPKTKKTNYQHKKSYEDKALENAVSAVLQKGMSIRKAALEFGINMSTLHRRCQQTRPRKKEYQQKKKNRDEALQNAVSAVLQKGMSIRKAALEFGTNMSTLHRHCRHKGPRKKEYPHKKSYDDEALENAVSAVLQKGMSIRKAALEFGIPPSTLNKRCHQTGPRKKVYQHKKSYDDEALENAVSAVLQKGMSIRKAALEFGIPSSTLNERCHQTGPRNEEYQHKKTYGDEAFENAVSAVLQKGMSIRKAALEFGIPPTTLHERLKRKDPTDSIARKVGWQKDFSNNQEECLAELLLYMAAHGLPATRKMLRDRVKELLQISGTACRVNIEMGPSNHWLRGFVKRHLLFDHMAETRPPLDPPESIKEFFDMYEKTIVECGLQNKDDQIFNCDGTRWTEKSFKLCPKTGHQLEMKTGTGSHVTAHMCISAGGRFLPSMLIYKESLPLAPIDGVPDTWLITASDTGLINSEIFSEWFTKIFIPNCGMERPVLLVMNNLYNPVSIPTMLAAKENSIILFGVPGNSTHILHPLVVEIFGELQATVHDISSSQLDASKRVVIEKTEYPAILSQAIDQTAPESVQHAFEVTGLCPVNREAIDMSKLAQVKDEPEGRMDCAGPMVENEREVIDMNLYLASDTVFGLCDEQESESSQEDVQIQKGLTPCSTLIQGQKRIITTPAGKKKRITSRYIINSKIYLDEEITCKIFTCSECKMEYSYARMFEGAEQKMCLDCALEHNFLSKDLFTVLNTGNISLQPSYSHSRKFWCTKCRHKYGLSMLYKVNDLNMFCKNCALELNYISQGTGDQLSSIKLCSCSKCKKQQEDKEIAAENSRLKHKKQHKDKEIAAENSCLKHKKQHKDKEIAAENSCLKHKKQHKDKEIAAENSRLKHKKQHKDKDIAAENQTKLNQSKQNINVIKKLPIDEEQMVEENNDLTKKCYLPMCPAPRQCSNYNQAGICMKDNLTSRKIAFTNFVKKKIAAKMKQKGVALDESNHSKESELSHVDDPQHPDLGNSAKGTSKVCVICHTNQDGNNVVWYQNDSQQICPLCFQKKLVEKCIEANQKRRKIAATDFKRKKSAAKMKQKGVKLDVSNHCKKRGSSLVDTKQHPDLDNSAKDTSKVCFICHINQDGKKTVVWHQIDSKPICFLCFKKKMVEKGKKEKLTRKKIAFTNFVKKKLAAKMKQKGVTLDESNHCIESDSSHVDTPQHLDLGNSAKDTSNVCVICHTNQDGNKAAVRHQIDSQPICSWCFKKKQEEKGSTNKETPYVAENHCRNYQKDKDLEKDCNDEVCKNTSSKKNGKYSPFDSKVNNLKALNKDRQNNALKHCHSDESIVCILDSSTASPTYAIDMAYDINEPELNSDNYIEVLECDAGEFDNEGDGSNDHRNVQTNENSAIKHILQKKGSERDIEVTDNDDKGFDFFKHLRSYGIAKDKKTPFDPRTSNQSKNINSLKNQGLPEEMKGANPFCETEAHTKQEMITEVLVCTHCSLRDQAGCVHHWYNVGGNFYCSDCFSLFQSALQDNHVSERNTTKFCLFIRFKKLSNSSIFDVEGVEFTAQFEELAKHEQKGEIDNTSVKDTETSPNKSNSLSMRCILDYKGCCRSMKCSSLCQHFREWRCGQVPLSFISDCHVSLCRIDGVCKRCKVRHIKISALDNQGVNKRKLRGKESQN